MSQQHDDTTRIETLLDESDGATATATPVEATEPTKPSEPSEPRTPSEPSEPSGPRSTAVPYAPYRGEAAVPEYKSGPAPTTSVVGLLGLLTVIAVLVAQATDLDIPWGVVGPVAVVGAGVLLVVLGLAGLRGQRFRG